MRTATRTLLLAGRRRVDHELSADRAAVGIEDPGDDSFVIAILTLPDDDDRTITRLGHSSFHGRRVTSPVLVHDARLVAILGPPLAGVVP